MNPLRVSFSRVVCGIIFLTMFLGALQAFAQDGVVLQQFHTRAALSFVELRNASDTPVLLDQVLLSNTADYFQITTGESDSFADGEFVVSFPEGSVMPPGNAVILLTGTSEDFVAAFGFVPEFTVVEPVEGSVQLTLFPEGQTATGPNPDGELWALFHWDGQSDLVEDLDLVFWGEDAPRVDKTDVGVDGPDEDDEDSSYNAETATEEQMPAMAWESSMALVRQGAEGTQSDGGNGRDGSDETSEDLSMSFAVETEPALDALVPIVGRLEVVGEDNIDGFVLRFAREDENDDIAVDAEGNFALELPVSSTYTVTLEEDAAVLNTTLVVGETAQRNVVLQAVVASDLTLSGNLEAIHGSPTIAGLVVSLAGEGLSVTVGADGAFMFPLEASEEEVVYTLEVMGDGIAPVSRTVPIAGEPVANIRLGIQEAYSIGGVVTAQDPAGPIAGATVRILGTGFEAQTDDEGRYEFVHVLSGVWTVAWEADGFMPLEREVALQSTQADLDVEMSAFTLGSLEVVVETSDGGSARDAQLTLTGGRLSRAQVEETNGDGEVRFDDLVVGSYNLLVALDGYQPLRVESVPVEGAASLTLLLIEEGRTPSVSAVEGCHTLPGQRDSGAWWLWIVALVGAGRLLRRRA